MTPVAHVEPEHHFVEHGGEVEVELAAASEVGIFAAALDAFAELVAGNQDGEPTEVQIELPRRDRTLLLVDWLNELLFLAEVEQFVPTHITSIERGDERPHVVSIVERAGLSRRVARLVPLGVVKG